MTQSQWSSMDRDAGYEASLREAAIERRARLMPPPPRKSIVIPDAVPQRETSKQRQRRSVAMHKRAAELQEPVIPVGEPLNMLTRPGIAFILHYVAKKHYLAPRDLTGPLRFIKIVRARQLAVWLIFHHCALVDGTPLSLPAIGRVFGRDHTTVLHSIRVVEKRRSQALFADSPAFNANPENSA